MARLALTYFYLWWLFVFVGASPVAPRLSGGGLTVGVAVLRAAIEAIEATRLPARNPGTLH